MREVRARLVVDATGPARAVIKPGVEIQGSYLSAKGLEYLIEVGPEHDLPEELVFFLGHHWTPFGYAWIFPMGAGRLKVGAGQMCFEGRAAASKPLKFYIEQVIREYLGQPDFKMIDIHGATLRYSRGMKDRFYDRGIIAVGDAVSAVNPLGGEGIRHGMVSANHAAHALGDVLGGKVRPEEAYKNYEREMRSYFGWKWKLSELLMTRVYAGMSDSRIDRGVKRLARLGTGERGLDQMIDLLFYYRFYRFAGTVTRSLASRLLKSVPFSKIIERKGYN